MKKLFAYLLLLTLCLFGTTFEIKACSVGGAPFKDLLNHYNTKSYMAVEGYYISEKKFMVTRSSDSSIKVGNEYEVLEYGPFGSLCEEYEMEVSGTSTLIGEEKPRLLIVFKNRCTNKKLVTPMSWGSGVDISNNKIVSIDGKFDSVSNKYVWYEYSISLDNVRKRLFEGKTEILEWEKEEINY